MKRILDYGTPKRSIVKPMIKLGCGVILLVILLVILSDLIMRGLIHWVAVGESVSPIKLYWLERVLHWLRIL